MQRETHIETSFLAKPDIRGKKFNGPFCFVFFFVVVVQIVLTKSMMVFHDPINRLVILYCEMSSHLGDIMLELMESQGDLLKDAELTPNITLCLPTRLILRESFNILPKIWENISGVRISSIKI